MKTIGIVGRTYYEGYFGAHNMYMKYLDRFGKVLVIPSWDTDSVCNFILDNVDLVVLPGGPDVLSVSYGDAPHYFAGSAQPHLEYFDTYVLPWILREGVPIFGICRGIQALNVCMGGTLIQNIENHPTSKERTDLVHTVNIRGIDLKVNSMHHQGIARLANDLTSLAVSPDGIVEAVVGNNIAAVQWHPEEIQDSLSEALITKLLKGE